MTLLEFSPLVWVPVLSGLLGLGTVTTLLQKPKTRYMPRRDLFVAWLFSALAIAPVLGLFAWAMS